MTNESLGWLVEARARPDASIALVFVDSHSRQRIERIIRPYVPYCLVSPDLGDEHVAKTNLFTGSSVKLSKIPISARPRGAEVWEDTIPPEMSCVYDLQLNFGAQHHLEDAMARPDLEIDPNGKAKFEREFGTFQQADPIKYDFLKRFHALLNQPLPDLDPVQLGLSSETTKDQYESALILSRIANLPPTQVQRKRSVSEWIRSALYAYYRANNILIPNPEELRRGSQRTSVEGALTFSPAPGLYYSMTVLDFESLYPSCIDRYNLSYETVDCEHPRCRTNRVPLTEHHVCLERRGIFSAFTGALRDLRVHWYKPRTRDSQIPREQRERMALTAKLLKLITVSCYGVTVRIRGLASPNLAESITAHGRYVLHKTWDIAEEIGLTPKYGDTDSIFLDRSNEEGITSLIRRVQDELNLELAVDKHYAMCVLTSAKKAYLGIQSDGNADVKGLTIAKSSSPPFFREVLSRLTTAMARVDEPDEVEKMRNDLLGIVEESVRELRSGRVGVEDLVYKVALWKEPKEKLESKVLPQAYQAAKLLQREGKGPHRREEIVFVKVRPFKIGGRSFTVKPPSETRASEVNREDYVRSLIQSLSQITDPMGIDLRRRRAKTLAEYM